MRRRSEVQRPCPSSPRCAAPLHPARPCSPTPASRPCRPAPGDLPLQYSGRQPASFAAPASLSDSSPPNNQDASSCSPCNFSLPFSQTSVHLFVFFHGSPDSPSLDAAGRSHEHHELRVADLHPFHPSSSPLHRRSATAASLAPIRRARCTPARTDATTCTSSSRCIQSPGPRRPLATTAPSPLGPPVRQPPPPILAATFVPRPW